MTRKRGNKKDWADVCSLRGCQVTPTVTIKTETMGAMLYSVRLCADHQHMSVLDVMRYNGLVNGR